MLRTLHLSRSKWGIRTPQTWRTDVTMFLVKDFVGLLSLLGAKHVHSLPAALSCEGLAVLGAFSQGVEEDAKAVPIR